MPNVFSFQQVVQQIADQLQYTEPEQLAELYNEIFVKKIKYIGDSLFEESA